ncbi:MAG: TatD family hydrolase [Bacteroidales bacterium]|nr:TatD family hydrolase [Bacteroidales bacterium]
MERYIDIHTHSYRQEVLSIVNILAHKMPEPNDIHYPVSIGIHPWFIKELELDKAIQNQRLLIEKSDYVVAIGECGLDRNIPLSIETQTEVFVNQVELANSSELPIIIHSVRSYADFFQLMKTGINKTPWIFHGFRSNYQIAKRIVDFGGYISIGASILQSNSMLNEVIKKIPLQRIFCETDDSKESIKSIYEFFAKTRSISVDELTHQIYQNFYYNFKHVIR